MTSKFRSLMSAGTVLIAVITALLSVVDVASKAMAETLQTARASRAWSLTLGCQVGAVRPARFKEAARLAFIAMGLAPVEAAELASLGVVPISGGAPNTVVLKGGGIRKEAKAAGAITPGHLLQRNAAGTVQVHGTAGGNASPLFAVENEVFGKAISDAYALSDTVLYEFLAPGAEAYALVGAGAAAVTAADLLESAGDGTLRKHTPQAVAEAGAANYTVFVRAPIARALETVDNSGGGAAVRIKVEIL